MKLAIAGAGNCACAFAQALGAISRGRKYSGSILGLKDASPLAHVEIVAAFDVDRRKVGRSLVDALFAEPNCVAKRHEPLASLAVVEPGAVMDGVDGPLSKVVEIAEACAGQSAATVANALRAAKAEVLLIYLPVGAQAAAEVYAEAALAAGCSVINNTPALLAGDCDWVARFEAAGLHLLGDDMKSYVGSTAFHQALLSMLSERSATVSNTYQLNIGGNTDFFNMRSPQRAEAKKRTKRAALARYLHDHEAYVGPSDYIPHLGDTKVGYIRIEGAGPFGSPFSVEVRLQVEDSENAAPVALEALMLLERLGCDRSLDVSDNCRRLFKSPRLS